MSGNSPDPATITTAILAGGAASRLGGQDKGLYALKNRPLIEWVVEAVRQDSPGPILIVANRNLSRYSRYAETISDSGSGHAGPLAGVCAALTACQTRWLQTIPVDCVRPPPMLTDELRASACEPDAMAVVANDGRRRQPLFALYSVDLLASCSAGLARSQGVSRWQDSIGVLEVCVARPSGEWINLNSPEEFAAYEDSLDEE